MKTTTNSSTWCLARLSTVGDRKFPVAPMLTGTVYLERSLERSASARHVDTLSICLQITWRPTSSRCKCPRSDSSHYRTQSTAKGSVFGAVSMFFVCVWNISGTADGICAKCTRETCLVPRSEVWRSRSKAKGQGQQGQKRHFSVLLAACVRFMFGKTSVASRSFFIDGLSKVTVPVV